LRATAGEPANFVSNVVFPAFTEAAPKSRLLTADRLLAEAHRVVRRREQGPTERPSDHARG